MQGHAVSYRPGPWVALVGRDADRTIGLLAELDPNGPVLAALWDAVERGAGADGLLGVVVREGLRSVPSFAIGEQTAGGVRVVVSGKARGEVTSAGGDPLVLAAADAPTWLDRWIERADGVRLSVDGAPEESGPALPLTAGAVLAAAVTIGTGSAPAPARPPETTGTTIVPPPQDTGLIEALPWQLTGDAGLPGPPPQPPQPQPPPAPAPAAAEPPPAPTVLAAVCPNRHLGPPHAGLCRVCGQPVPQQDPISVPRPVLGVLNLSTGDMVPLDRDIVFGRAPSVTDTEPSLKPHLVQLASPTNDISRSHLRISLEGWHVQAVDLGSTNGTIVTLPGQRPVRLRPHDPFTIVPGSVVSLAEEVSLRYEVTG